MREIKKREKMEIKFTGKRDQEFEEKIRLALESAVEHVKMEGLSKFLPPLVIVENNTRMRSCAGRALCKYDMIKLNYRLLKSNPHEIKNTAIHELAHIFTWKQKEARYFYSRNFRHHGPQFQKNMRLMGEAYSRCHRMDTSELKRRHKRYKFVCDCPDKVHELTAHKAKKFTNYSCRTCIAELRPLKSNFNSLLALLYSEGNDVSTAYWDMYFNSTGTIKIQRIS